MDAFYTTEDVARLLKLKVETVRKYIREKKLPAVKLNRQYRISQEQLEKFLKSNGYTLEGSNGRAKDACNS